MQLKIIFTVINVLSIILLHIIAFIIRPEKNYLKTTKKLLLSATVAIFANILIYSFLLTVVTILKFVLGPCLTFNVVAVTSPVCVPTV